MINKTQNKNSNKLIIRIILSLFLFSSQNVFSQEKKPLIRPMTPNRSIEECRKLVIEKGDTMAYSDLYWHFAKRNREADYFFYSLFMIEKYNYEEAYYWVYASIVSFYGKNKIPLSGQALNLALEYLGQGAELGVPNAQIELGELYLKGKYMPQDTIKGAELQAKGKQHYK